MKKTLSLLLSLLMGLYAINNYPFIVNANIKSTSSTIESSESEAIGETCAFENHLYQLFKNDFSSYEACENYCEVLGGHLAIIESKEENDFIYSLISKESIKGNVFFGMYELSDGKWVDVLGNPLTYFNWANGEPNNDQDVDEGIINWLTYDNGKWNDTYFDGGYCDYFVCEWESDNSTTNENSNMLYLSECNRISWDRYTGNLGDSRLNVLGEQYEYGYGNTGLNGEKFNNGFEAWIARWNYTKEISWVQGTYKLDGQFVTLSGYTDLIKSYNTSNFDTTIFFYNGNNLIESYRLTNNDYKKRILVDVSGVDELTLLVKDNVAVSGGTSFALYNLVLCGKDVDNENLSIDDYICENISKHYDYIMSTEGPAGPLMDDAWDVNKIANAFVQSSAHLFNGKTTDQSIQEYYDAVLFDLIANTYTLPNFDSYMEKQFTKLQNSMINYFIGQGFDLTKNINDSSNLGLFYDYIEEFMGAKMTSYELTYDLINSVADGCDDALECIDLLSQYILVHEQGKDLESALKTIKSFAVDDNFRKAISDVEASLSMTPQQYVDKIVAKKMIEYGLTLAEKVAEEIVKDIIVIGFNKVFPLSEIKLIVELTSYLCDTFFATTVNSNQQYRLYIYVKVETACKRALEYSYNYGSPGEISSCYEMYLRIFEHEIRECLNFADIYFNQGLFNQIKNYMKLNGGSYENAVDWINSYRYPLNNLKAIKTNAQKRWGLDTGVLVYLYEICLFDGMIAGFKEHIVDVGYEYNKEKDDIIESYIHSLSGKTVIIDSVYYDSEMKNEIRQFPITINENTALYYNFHEVNNDVHRHSYKSVVTKKATPTATGVRTFTCTVCGATKTETIAKCAKYANPISAKGKTATVKLANLKKKNQTILQKNAFAISKAQGKVTFKKASGNKKITVVKSGKITVKKGLKKGTYKVKVKVTAAGNANYKALAKTVTVVIKVK